MLFCLISFSHLLSPLWHPPKVRKVRETITTLGPMSHSGDPADFLLKLKADPLSWAIIDKQADQANDLVSVWQIIHQQLPSFEGDPSKIERLRQSAKYMSTRWQDDIESKLKVLCFALGSVIFLIISMKHYSLIMSRVEGF